MSQKWNGTFFLYLATNIYLKAKYFIKIELMVRMYLTYLGKVHRLLYNFCLGYLDCMLFEVETQNVYVHCLAQWGSSL